jgi:UDP-N-acetylmuramate--alanine ligase
VQNSLAAIAVARQVGVPDETIRSAIAAFGGVKRRFTKTGVWNGVTIIDDYGHHPVEIAAVMKAARQAALGKIIAVLQPHRYSRLKSLFNEFSTCLHGADTVIVTDVYAAGEAPLDGVNRDTLIESMRSHGHRHVLALDSAEDLPRVIHDLAKPLDYVVCLGAGSITNWAQALPGQLQAMSSGPGEGEG